MIKKATSSGTAFTGGTVTSSIVPSADNTLRLGSGGAYWLEVFAETLYAEQIYNRSAGNPFICISQKSAGSSAKGFTFNTANAFGAGDMVAAFQNNNVNTVTIGAEGGLRANAGNVAIPTASATYRGQIYVVEGGGGVADTIKVCLKAAGGTYSWVTVGTG